jgi:hypothetical protein
VLDDHHPVVATHKNNRASSSLSLGEITINTANADFLTIREITRTQKMG